jgi:dihydrofolate synthase/folylpolyglutamate synthase
MDYRQSVEYVENAGLFGAHKHGLDNIRILLERLGNPQDRFVSIHVAGTNGKGSVCACMDAILRRQGIRTGLYTSPYLERFTERIRLNGKEITKESFACIATRVREAAQSMVDDGLTHPTFFELVTACGFLAFAEGGVEVAVIETGLGGRLDATNVLRPAVTVITAIGLDHTKVLGDTVEAIAREKAGIIKTGVPVIVYPQPFAEAYAELLGAARLREAPLYAVRDAAIVVEESGLSGQRFTMSYQGMNLGEFTTGLLGAHQVLNCATAILAAVVFGQLELFPLELSSIRQGIAQVRWPGRLEVVSRDPLILLDGAHNPQGAQQLADAVNRITPNHNGVLLAGALKTKDVDQVARILAPVAETVITTRPPTEKALSAREMADAFGAWNCPSMVQEDPATALSMAVALARGKGCPLIVTGSLYLVGAVRAMLEKNF